MVERDVINGHAVRVERGRLRMTQQELADHLGQSRRTVVAWEAGERPVPVTAYAKLQELFGMGDEPARADLSTVSDMELLAELMRRAAARDASRSGNG